MLYYCYRLYFYNRSFKLKNSLLKQENTILEKAIRENENDSEQKENEEKDKDDKDRKKKIKIDQLFWQKNP